jgi:hypothetical protein
MSMPSIIIVRPGTEPKYSKSDLHHQLSLHGDCEISVLGASLLLAHPPSSRCVQEHGRTIPLAAIAGSLVAIGPRSRAAWREIADACDKLANIAEQSETAVAE